MIRAPVRIRRLESPGARFARQALIDGWDQDRLAALRVVVFGAGALGNEVIKNLALAGAGVLLIVDQDVVEPGNLSRSVLFREQDAGRPKAVVAAERARELYPALDTRPLVGDLHLVLGPGRLSGYDVALACLDSVDARLGVDTLCRRARLPWWNGGLGPSSCEITRYAPGAGGPCYGCTLSSRARAREQQRWSCQHGRPSDLPPRVLPTTAVSASLGGALMVQEAIASLMPSWKGRALPAGARLLLEAAPYRLTRFDVPRDPRCPDHLDDGEAPVALDHDHHASGRQVLDGLGCDPARLEVHLDFDLVLAWRCRCPGGRREPWVPVRASLGPCEGCGSRPEDFETTTCLPGDHAAFDLPLRRIGVPDGGELVVWDGTRARTLRLSPTAT